MTTDELLDLKKSKAFSKLAKLAKIAVKNAGKSDLIMQRAYDAFCAHYDLMIADPDILIKPMSLSPDYLFYEIRKSQIAALNAPIIRAMDRAYTLQNLRSKQDNRI